MLEAVSETIFDSAAYHIDMLRWKLGTMGSCMLECTDLQKYQIKFLFMCVERQAALRGFTSYSKDNAQVMELSNKMWTNVLDDFREGLSEPGIPSTSCWSFGNFIEEWFQEIDFPWLRQNGSETNQTKFDAVLEGKGVCVCEDSSNEPAPAEGEDLSVDSSEDDEWDEIYNHGGWSKPLEFYRNIAVIEMLIYSGGPSGGYATQDGQLYDWRQNWGTPKRMTKRSGYLIVKETEYSSSHSRYYECLHCDEDAKLENVLKQYGLKIDQVCVFPQMLHM